MIKIHSLLISVAVAAVASCAFAESDPFADRVQDGMKRINESDKTSNKLNQHASNEKHEDGSRDLRGAAKSAEMTHSDEIRNTSSQKPHRDKKKPKHGHKHK